MQRCRDAGKLHISPQVQKHIANLALSCCGHNKAQHGIQLVHLHIFKYITTLFDSHEGTVEGTERNKKRNRREQQKEQQGHQRNSKRNRKEQQKEQQKEQKGTYRNFFEKKKRRSGTGNGKGTAFRKTLSAVGVITCHGCKSPQCLQGHEL